MTAVAKVSYRHGLLVKAESTYLGGGTLSTSTDGVYLPERPAVSPAVLNDGSRLAMGGGRMRGTRYVGRHATFPVRVHAKGYGAAYSGSNLPYDSHRFILGAGYTHAVDTTGGAERVTYTPILGAGPFTSNVIQLYADGTVQKYIGCVSDLTIDAPELGPISFLFNVSGVWDEATYADISLPSITVAGTSLTPIIAEGMTVSIGNYTNAVLRSFNFTNGRTPAARQNLRIAGGHGGFHLPNPAPVLTMTIEQPALTGAPFHAASALDPIRLMDAATSVAVTLGAGTAAGSSYNRLELSCPQAQIVAAEAVELDGGISGWNLTVHPHQSTPYANDDHSIVFK